MRCQSIIGPRKFLECEARNLRYHVIDRRLERRRRRAACDLVPEFIQRVTNGQFGSDLRDRKARRFRRQRRRTRHPGVHLDNQHAAGLGADRELHVGTTSVDADLSQHVDGCIAQPLVLLIRQRLRWRHRDRVARVDTHRIDVLDRANDDAVVVPITNDFHLEFLPANYRFFQQNLGRRRHLEAVSDYALELFTVIGNSTTAATHRKRRTDDRREAHIRLLVERLLERMRDLCSRDLQVDLGHRFAKQVTVLRHVDRLARGCDHLDIVFLENAFANEIQGTIERRLAAHRRQQRIRPLFCNDPLESPPLDRLDVNGVRHIRIGHDGRRV